MIDNGSAILMEKVEEPMTVSLKRTSGLLVVLSAPSGAGKSTISRALLDSDAGLRYSVSVTTRRPRADEVNGKHYFFVNEPEFEDMIERGEFYEYARVHGNLYGTRKAWIEEQLSKCRDIILDIDVQGGESIKNLLPAAVLVFILPPSMKELARRLRSRAADDDETIRRRLENARREIIHSSGYDYLVVNDDLEETIRRIRAIVEVERMRSERLHIATREDSEKE